MKRSPPTKRKSTTAAVKQEVPSPEKEKENNKGNKTETVKKTPAKKTPEKKTPVKKTPAKKKSPKSSDKSKAKKATPLKSASPVKKEIASPVEAKTESPTKVKSEEKSTDVKTEVKEEKPKINPFFTKQKEMKLQSTEGASDGLSYDPGKSNYHPIKDCFWKHGEKHVFKHFNPTKNSIRHFLTSKFIYS